MIQSSKRALPRYTAILHNLTFLNAQEFSLPEDFVEQHHVL